MIASRSMFLVLCFLGENAMPQELPQALGAELRVRGPCRAASSAARGPREAVRQPNSSACHNKIQVAREARIILARERGERGEARTPRVRRWAVARNVVSTPEKLAAFKTLEQAA